MSFLVNYVSIFFFFICIFSILFLFISLLKLSHFFLFKSHNDKSNLYSNRMNSTQAFFMLLLVVLLLQGISSTCPQGYYSQSGRCYPSLIKSNLNTPKQPLTSFFSSKYFTNVLTNCKENQIWDGNNCICQKGFFRIFQVCTKCDPNSDYVGYDCICKKGFFGYGKERCYQCHKSCQKCFGPLDSQCISCIDAQQVLTKVNGIDKVCTSSFISPQSQRSHLNLENYLIQGQKIIQGIHLSELPKQLTSEKSCFYCDKVLLIQARSSTGLLAPSKVQYRQGSHYKIQAQFDFQGFFPQLQVIVEINPLYKPYFNALDQNQRVTKLIQLANYATASSGTTLKGSSIGQTTSGTSTSSLYPVSLFP